MMTFTTPASSGGGSGSAVGKYVLQTDLESFYDPEVIRLWSRKGPTEQATDVPAVQRAIDTAEALIDAKLKKRYVMPIDPLEAIDLSVLMPIARSLAAYELFFSRPVASADEEAISLKSQRKAALEELKLYTDGLQYLEAEQIDRTPQAPGVV